MATGSSTTSKKGRKGTYDGPSPEEKLCAALIECLQAGVNPWRKPWDGERGGSAGRHRNLMTGQAYRGSNPAVLEMWSACRGYGLPLWLGSAQARGKGWFPRKGSKGCYVLRPQLNKRGQEDENGQPIKGPDGQPLTVAWVSYKPACVFNVADLVGGDEASQAALEAAIAAEQGAVINRPEPDRHAAAETVLSAWPVPVSWGGDRAFYSPAGDRIGMPSRKAFKSQEGLYSTWAHEEAHSTGHKDRLARPMGGTFGTEPYAREELVAELASFLICNRLEIGCETENHAAYLKSWLGVLGEGPKVLFKVLSDATKAANLICGPEVTEEG